MRQRFDDVIERRGTNSLKWEFVPQEDDPLCWEETECFFGEGQILPMWVADIDFLALERLMRQEARVYLDEG